MLLQRPVISGRYSAAPFVNMLSGALDEALRPLFATLVHMGELVHSILCEEPRSDRAQVSQLEAVIQDVEAHRYHHIGNGGMMSTLGMRAFASKADCCLCLHVVCHLKLLRVVDNCAVVCDTLDGFWSYDVTGLPYIHRHRKTAVCVEECLQCGTFAGTQ